MTAAQPIHCERLVIVFSPDRGHCRLGKRCPAEHLRRDSYSAFLLAHSGFALPSARHYRTWPTECAVDEGGQ